MCIRDRLITDGRFSGASRGASIGHVCPEAAVGGPIALVEEGDIISINIPENRLDVKVSEEEMESRRAKWQPRQPQVTTGYLDRYRKMVTLSLIHISMYVNGRPSQKDFRILDGMTELFRNPVQYLFRFSHNFRADSVARYTTDM